MMISRLVAVGLAVAIAASTPARAQVTVDLSKITCDQWLSYKVADPDHIAIWLSGYFNAKRNNTVIGVQEFKENIGRLKEACFRQLNAPLMQVIEAQMDKK
jgi:acid stress chaperone HdeB